MAIIRAEAPSHLEALRRFALDFQPTVVHVHSGMLWDFASTLALRAPRMFSVHVAQTLLNRWRGLTEETHSSRGYRAAVAGADQIVVADEGVRLALVSDDETLRDRVQTLKRGIEDPARARAAVARRATGELGGAILYVGRFADVKGTRELIAVLGELVNRHPEVPVRIVGGIPGSPKKAKRWRRRFEEALPPTADWTMTGWLSAEEVSRELVDARVLLVPSHMETFGLVALEGMLHGVPLVTSDCLGLRTLIESGVSGVQVPAGDIAAMVGASSRVLSSPKWSNGLGLTAAARARDAYLWEHVIQSWLRAYEGVASRTHRP